MKWTRLALFFVSALLIPGFTGRSASAGGLMVYVSTFNEDFGIIDLSNPANVTYQSILAPRQRLFGLGVTSDGIVYGLNDDATNAHLFKINPALPSITDLGAV